MKVQWNWFVALALLDGADGSALLELTNLSATESVPTLSEKTQCDDLLAWRPPRTDPTVVLQVVSKHYLELELNFIYHMELHSTFRRDNLFMICLDEESSIFLESQLGIRCADYRHEGAEMDRGEVWVLRTNVTSCLLLAGYDVLLSDADAIWLKDPIEQMMSVFGEKTSNVVASRGKGPLYFGRKWGSTLCFGFILFRAGGSGMSKLVNALRENASRLHNDQQALNQALHDFGIAWDPESDMGLEGSTRLGTGTVEYLADNGEDFVVTLLPHKSFTRWCESTPISNDTVVAHCHSKNKGEAMEFWMKEANLWASFDYDTHQFSPP